MESRVHKVTLRTFEKIMLTMNGFAFIYFDGGFKLFKGYRHGYRRI